MQFVAAIRERNKHRAQQRASTMKLNQGIRDFSNPFNDPNFSKVYRFSADATLRIIAEVKPFYPSTHYSNAIAVEHKFLAALHFFAQGSYQKSCGKDAGFIQSQSSMSRAITQTVAALNNPALLRQWIKFPTQRRSREDVIAKNYRRFGMPGVVGYVDGTHIDIAKPKDHEELYVNRKGVHSLNVQVVCDCDLKILNVCARYPGCSHDSFIWKSSNVRHALRAAYEESRCYLLGDSGYPLEPWLLTPILDAPEGSREGHYTRLHIRSRNCIERCFGVLKGHWQCINKRRTLNYAPEKAGLIFNACAVLHNIGIRENIGDPEIVDFDEQDIGPVRLQNENELRSEGLQVRAELVQHLCQ